MTAIKSTPERTHLGTLNEKQARLLVTQQQKVAQLRALLGEQESQYRSMIELVMPEGANLFDPDSMSFFYVEPPKPKLVEGAETEE